VSNQEAMNDVRFEPNLSGQFVKNRITTIDPASGIVTPRHLNDHIDYDDPTGSAAERALSLSTPLGMAISSDGSAVYVAAMGSRKVGVCDAAGVLQRRIPVGEGPTGVALDEARARLYVVNRFSSSLSVVDLANDSSFEVSLGCDPSTTDVAGSSSTTASCPPRTEISRARAATSSEPWTTSAGISAIPRGRSFRTSRWEAFIR
jgi:DNA-binding beta-propeller fold protein YncE